LKIPFLSSAEGFPALRENEWADSKCDWQVRQGKENTLAHIARMAPMQNFFTAKTTTDAQKFAGNISCEVNISFV
jgi:hypothetical protein